MRAFHREPLNLLCFYYLAPTALAYSLADVQQITGFGPACTNAYSTPFKSCTSNDFYGDKGCSTACATSIAPLIANINEACNGHTAIPSTLIGMILSGNALETLCPGATTSAGGSGSPAGGSGNGNGNGGGNGGGNGNGKSSAHLSPTNGVASQSPTTLAASKVSSTSTSSFGLHSYLTPIVATPPSTTITLAISTLTPAATTTSLSTVPSTTLQISTSALTLTIPLSDLTRVSSTPTTTIAATATSLTTTSSSSTSQETSQGNNPQGAGGGTPFDITSASCRNRRNAWWPMSVPAAIFILLWLF